MASPTKQTRGIRTRKARARGAESKAERRNKGTTLSYETLFGVPKSANSGQPQATKD